MADNPKVRVTNIAFDDAEFPSEVTVVLPIAVAAWLTKLAGRMAPSDSGYEHSSPVYGALSNTVFRFWEDGVDEYVRSS